MLTVNDFRQAAEGDLNFFFFRILIGLKYQKLLAVFFHIRRASFVYRNHNRGRKAGVDGVDVFPNILYPILSERALNSEKFFYSIIILYLPKIELTNLQQLLSWHYA